MVEKGVTINVCLASTIFKNAAQKYVKDCTNAIWYEYAHTSINLAGTPVILAILLVPMDNWIGVFSTLNV